MIPFAMIDRFIPNIRVIAEIGAADGEDTKRYLTRYPNAMVLAFEPLPANVQKLLVLWIGDEARLRVFPVALGYVNGKKTFYASGGQPPGRSSTLPWPYSGSLLPPKEHLTVHPWCTFAETQVHVVRFDEVASTIAPRPTDVDFVHIDVQGSELDALCGMGCYLDTVRGVWIEVSTVELYEGQPLREDVSAFMRGAGFTLRLDTVGVESQIAGDQLWTR